MVTPGEAPPPPLASLMAGNDGENRLFRSPLRLYQLLAELTSLARRHGGSSGAFTEKHSVSPWVLAAIIALAGLEAIIVYRRRRRVLEA